MSQMPPASDWHARSVEDTFQRLQSGPQGLSPEEAARRLAEYGPNTLREAKATPAWKMLLSQFTSLLMVILIVAAVVSALMGELIDTVVIFAIVILSALVGFIQEWRAEKAIEALKRMAAPQADVIRGGQHIRIPSAEVVPGDVLVLQTGERIPADCRVIEAASLKVDEAALTGESVPVRKEPKTLPHPEVSLGDRINMGYMATVITYGRGKAVVVATGMATEFGRIAGMLQEVPHEKTPLEARLDVIGRVLAGIALGACALGVGLGVMRGYPLFDMFLWGVSLAVAAVPEALPAVVTGALAIGARRMARRHAIVKRLPAVETLGSTTVICTDKTGTLTRNEMTVRRVWVVGRLYEVGGTGYAPQGGFRLEGKDVLPSEDPALRLLAEVGLNCNDASIREEAGAWKLSGDPTEGAMVALAHKAGLKERCRRVLEAPFESDRKRMSVVCPLEGGEGGFVIYTKGAPESVLGCCSHILDEAGVRPISAADRAAVAQVAEGLAGEALRVLGFALRTARDKPSESHEDIERELTFVGLQAMIDPPREEAKEAIARCLAAGIKPVMVTGDHRSTAAAIARELGQLREGQEVVTGHELDRMSDDDLTRRVEEIAVYARVSPEHKLRIVDAFKRRGEVVAMTGDGVNDAPALKRADIGVAMGITGTGVTKEAGEIILADDNFATIVAAVEEGRAIYDNIKKYLVFLLSCNIAEILVLVGAFFVGLPLPLIALQILWVNLTTDGLPALALGVDPPDPGIMARPPRHPAEGVFDRRVVVLIGTIAVWITALLLPLFAYYLAANPDAEPTAELALVKAQTIVFAALILFELFNAYNCRSERFSAFKAGLFRNRWLNWAVLISAGLMLAVIQVPALDELFHTSLLLGRDWLVVVPLALTIIPVVELTKWLLNRRYPDQGTSGG